MTDPRDREIDRLEQALGQTDDPQEQRELVEDLRELEREQAEESRWLEEGIDRGYF